jgi:hypothetical protein
LPGPRPVVYVSNTLQGKPGGGPGPRGAGRRKSPRGRGRGYRRHRETEGIGTVGRLDGDPSGSSSGPPDGGSKPPQSLLGDERMRFSDRTPPLGVGSPARHRTDESPERVEASAKAPSGLSRLVAGGDPLRSGGGEPPSTSLCSVGPPLPRGDNLVPLRSGGTVRPEAGRGGCWPRATLSATPRRGHGSVA